MTDSSNAIIQNLIDAGCDEQLIGQFMSLQSQSKTKEMSILLSKHRKSLLDSVHSAERKIYCLDYLLNKITK